MRIVLLGISASGKGTQGKLLSGFLGIPHISVGDCIRDAKQTDTPLGQQIRTLQREPWQPLPDLLVHKIFLQYAADKCIVDGFPRSMDQLDLFKPTVDDIFIYLCISEATSLERIKTRNRDDDIILYWRSRMALDNRQLPGVIATMLPIVIDAEQPVPVVFGDIKYELAKRGILNKPA